MASPAYMWIKDENGNDIIGDSEVKDREGTVEVLSFQYGVELPVDRFNGVTNGTRQHLMATITKSFDASTPVLFQAACDGRTLKQATIRWYRINPDGKEEEYFSHHLEDVKVVSFHQQLNHVKEPSSKIKTHEDVVSLRFSKIVVKHHDGNIEASDTWLNRS